MLRYLLVFCLPLSAYALISEPAILDLGTYKQKQQIETSVILKNEKSEPILIKQVSTDCGCTAVTPPKLELAGNETVVLPIKFETREYNGNIVRRVTVITNDGTTLVIPIKVNVNPFGNWNCSVNAITFPTTSIKEAATVTLTVNPPITQQINPLRIDSIWSDVPWLTASFIWNEVLNTYQVTLTKKANAPAGSLSGTLSLKTNDSLTPELRLPVFAIVKSDLHVFPNPLTLGTTRVGQPRTGTLIIEGWTNEKAPEFLFPNGNVTIKSISGNTITLAVQVVPSKVGITNLKLYILNPQDSNNPKDNKERLLCEVPIVFRALNPL